MSFIPALIAGVSAVGGSLANVFQGSREAKTARDNTDKTILANKNLAEYQYSKDLDMWNMQNVYNSPENQMKRFTDAGLNPNLIYGQGNAGNASTLPKYQAPRVEYNYKPKVHPLMTIGAYQDYAIKNAQLDNLREQTNLTKTKGIVELLNSEWLKDRNDKQVGYLGYWQNKMVQEQNKSNLALYNATIRKYQMQSFKDLLEANMANIKTRTEASQADIGLKNKNLDLMNMGLPWMQPILNFLRLLKN